MNLKEGQIVSIAGVGGYSIVRLMSQTAKVKKDGKTSIRPIVMLMTDETGTPAEGESEVSGNDLKTPLDNAEPVDAKPENEKPAKVGKPAKAVKPVKSENPAEAKQPDHVGIGVEDEEEGIIPHDKKTDGSVEKKLYPRNKGDNVSKQLSGCESLKQLEKVVRAHGAFAHINGDAFRTLVETGSEIQFGLARMRMGNLLRGAISRSRKK